METVELLVKLKIPRRNSPDGRRRTSPADGLCQRAEEFAPGGLLPAGAERGWPEAAQELARELLRMTNVFVNPNKHVYEGPGSR
jgi:hypothetical protein